jgi:hypothetical protein
MIIYTPYLSRELRIFKIIIIYIFFIEFIDNEKIRGIDEANDDIYMLHV